MYYIPAIADRRGSMRHLLATMTIALSLPAIAQVPNFTLSDATGAPHELYRLADRTAVVVMVQGNGCPMVRTALPALREVRERYRARGVEFLLLNANLQDNPETVRREAAEFGIDFPILLDTQQKVAASLGVIRTAEVFVLDPRGWVVVYRGPVDDRATYERQKAQATAHYLVDVLDRLQAGEPVAFSKRDAPGCLIRLAAQ